MNILKTIVAASAIAAASFSAYAEEVSVGGVTWETDYVDASGSTQSNDFFSSGDYSSELTGNVLSGGGLITTLNGQNTSEFCPSCTLSFSFDGFIVDFAGGQDANNNYVVDTTAATLDFTVTDSNDVSSTWLSLVGDGLGLYAGYGGGLSTFTGLFNVLEVPGTAWKNFDTNTLPGLTDFELIANEFGLTSSTFKSNSVPAPTTLAIFGLGLLGLARLRKA